MTIIEHIIAIDKALFTLINAVNVGNWTHIIVLWRHPYFWLPLYIFVFYYIIKNHRHKLLLVVIFIIFTMIISDTLSSHIIKPFFERMRPCNNPNVFVKLLLSHCGVGYSFTSSHATNHFALAFILSKIVFPSKIAKILLLLWAGSICYVQVLVGVHFPLDVFFGAILGMSIGYCMATIYKTVAKPK